MGKILVVDDEAKITKLYKNLLRGEGYDAIAAPDAHWAVNRLITQKDVRLILLDIGMPHIDGVMFNEAAHEFDPQIKVIVTSAQPLSEQRRLILHADDYYEKSQSLDVLLAKVHDALRHDGPPANLLEAFTRRDVYMASPLHRAFIDRRKRVRECAC